MQVYEYSNNTLHYRLINGLDKDVEVKCDVTLYQIKGSERVMIYQDLDDEKLEIDSKYAEEQYINLEKERLEAGKYVIEAFGYEAEFEIR